MDQLIGVIKNTLLSKNKFNSFAMSKQNEDYLRKFIYYLILNTKP
jgi:hypothetical protein